MNPGKGGGGGGPREDGGDVSLFKLNGVEILGNSP